MLSSLQLYLSTSEIDLFRDINNDMDVASRVTDASSFEREISRSPHTQVLNLLKANTVNI